MESDDVRHGVACYFLLTGQYTLREMDDDQLSIDYICVRLV